MILIFKIIENGDLAHFCVFVQLHKLHVVGICSEVSQAVRESSMSRNQCVTLSEQNNKNREAVHMVVYAIDWIFTFSI